MVDSHRRMGQSRSSAKKTPTPAEIRDNVEKNEPGNFRRSQEARSKVESAAHDTLGDAGTGPGHDESQRERRARISREEERLGNWAEKNGRLGGKIPREDTRGSEHIVEIPKNFGGRIFKATRTDSHLGYGFAYGSHIYGATPGEYLDRISRQNRIFGDDIHIERVVPIGIKLSIVTSQPFIRGRDSTQDEIDDMMIHEKNFEKFRDGMYYHSGEGILVSDLFPKNSKTDASGIVYPIDPVIQRVEPSFANFMRNYDIGGNR